MKNDQSIDISFVIPCYRSAKTIVPVLDEIASIMVERADMKYEVITVVDGSPDEVFEVLRQASADHPFLKIINLSKNFGQANASMAGYNHAKGAVVVGLDDDGQCPLDQLWRLLAPLHDGADLAVAHYPEKKQSWFKNFGSRMNAFMSRAVIGIPKDFHMSNFFAFNKFVNEQLACYKNPYPYFSGLVFRATSNVVNVEMEQRDRAQGTSNYTFGKMLRLWMNGFTSFSIRPLRVADVCGMICAIGGFLFGLCTVVARILDPTMQPGYSSIIASLFFIGGVLMILLGLIGEYVGRIMIILNDTPQYIIRERFGFEGEVSGREEG